MRADWKTIAAGLLIISLIVLVIPRDSGQDEPDGGRTRSAAELKYKQQIMEQDVLLTEKLCRNQCKLDIGHMMKSASANPQGMNANELSDMQREHPHMMYLESGWNGKTIQQGSIDTLPVEVAPYIELARDSAKAGRSYESPRISTDDGPYFVLAVQSSDEGKDGKVRNGRDGNRKGENGRGGNGYMLGAVKQKVLDHVRIEQRKNLRLVPYPSEARFGIQAADSDTLEQVDVDHPEENEDVSHYYKNDIVVRFAVEPDEREMERISQTVDADKVFKSGYAYVFHSKSWSAEKLMEYFTNNHDIHYAEPHYLYVTNSSNEATATLEATEATEANKATEAIGAIEAIEVNEATTAPSAPDASPDGAVAWEPNDALYSDYQWNLPIIRTEAGWQVTEDGQEVIIAVVDTGVDLNHPDLKNKLVSGYNVYTGGSDAGDDVGHGTHVAGIIAAQINNYEGIAGLAPNSKIMPVKVLDESGAGSTYAVAEGIIWAADNGAQVINMSLGNYAEAEFLHDAIRYAYDKGVVLIAATGNDNTESPGYPAAYEEVFAVGATDNNQAVAQFSNYGEYLDVAAPGVSIASTYPGNQYAALSGTSMASPHVAALAGMIRSANPNLTNVEVMELIRSTSSDLGDSGHDIYYGYGQINVEKALVGARSSEQSIVKWGENMQRSINNIIAKYE